MASASAILIIGLGTHDGPWVAALTSPLSRTDLPLARALPAHGGESVGILGDGFRDGTTTDELAFPATRDKAGVIQDLQMVSNRRRGHALELCNGAAGHITAGGDGSVDAESRFVAQSFRDFLDLRAVHFSRLASREQDSNSCRTETAAGVARSTVNLM